MSRCDSAAIVPNTSELLPEPETPVKAVNRRLGRSTLTSSRLFTRAPTTRITSWRSAFVRAAMREMVPRRAGRPSRAGDGHLEGRRLVGGESEASAFGLDQAPGEV